MAWKYCCDGYMCGCNGQPLPQVCGQCGADIPAHQDHCSPECAARWKAMLAQAKGVA